uniref:Metacaspase-1A n=1 Tax=Anthurium amnicola TaxID=1678845 RepID=A0A1D1ZF78_9ARAE
MDAQRPLDLKLISARDLKNVNIFSKMDVYAVAWLSGDPRSKGRTATDREGGRNPSWTNAAFRFFVPAGGVETGRLVLHVRLRSKRALGDRDIGEVRVPVKELESTPGAGDSPRFVSYEVRRPSGKAGGVLNFSFGFGAPVAAPAPWPPHPAPYPVHKADEPVTAYPAGLTAAYPPLPQPYGYGAPPPSGYGYPPPAPAGYGYGAPPPPRRNKFGMGLGAGLLGGALGGLLVGDMISDAAAYDGGFDGGGYDF